MGIVSNIVCKGIGVAGMSAILYDAYQVGKSHSKRTSQQLTADHFEKVIANTRTNSSESPVSCAMQKKISNFRMSNPIISSVGNITGAVSGFLGSLGENIIPAITTSTALAGKGKWAKAGAWGTVGYALYIIAREGFGFTKKTPMD